MKRESHHLGGLVELDGRHGGHLRQISIELERSSGDPKVSSQLIHTLKLREASLIESTFNGGSMLQDIRQVKTVNGVSVKEWMEIEDFSRRTAVDRKSVV